MKTQKDYKTILVEYCRNLSDYDLKFVSSRLNEKYPGDLPDVLNFMSRLSMIDEILRSAQTADDLYQLCDVIADISIKECKKRGISFWNERIA
jgi:hypothetical protein